MPGVSRSGATIGGRHAAGLRARRRSREFSFLLSVPAIAGRGREERPRDCATLACPSADAQVFAIGLVTSGLVGYAGRDVPPALPDHASPRRVRLVSHSALAAAICGVAGDAVIAHVASGCAGVSSPGSSSPCRWWSASSRSSGCSGGVDSLTSGLAERLVGRHVPGLGILATAADRAGDRHAVRPTSSAGACCSAGRGAAAARAALSDDLRARSSS